VCCEPKLAWKVDERRQMRRKGWGVAQPMLALSALRVRSGSSMCKLAKHTCQSTNHHMVIRLLRGVEGLEDLQEKKTQAFGGAMEEEGWQAAQQEALMTH